MFEQFVSFVQQLYAATPGEFVPLHVPRFRGNEKKYLLDCIDSTFVSSVGEYVNRFEQLMAEITGTKYAIAVVNGTNALHVALRIAGVKQNDLVISQPLSFIATCNAIRYQGAEPLFVDVDSETLGLSPVKLQEFLEHEAYVNEKGESIHKTSGQRIAACVPMHTFGHSAKIEEIVTVCQKYHIPVIEDAAESLGSYYKDKHTGTFGRAGVISFNGNKTVTSGGGGAILTNDADFAHKAKHLTTQAKQPHAWEYVHDEIGYNYRMPNLNAALACAQLEQLPVFLQSKRKIAKDYAHFFESYEQTFIAEPVNSESNFWLNTVLMKNLEERDAFLQYTNSHGVMTRPAWKLMHQLPMFLNCIRGDLTIAESLASRLVNIPSSVI
ncbi:LegC family aminotransferase [Catalinimonas sp. 4WD22]|uniref:LegC family aminotransferase n=1 Tax=Catalinimonas locisalis TaxID=3133978 RepID=UPI003101261C